MAMYTHGVLGFIQDGLDWNSSAFKVMLVTTTYSYDADHANREDITNEITNGGYSTGGNALGSPTASEDAGGNEVEADAADTTFTSLAAGDQPFAAVVYADVGTAATDTLISYNVLTTPPAPDGNNYIIQWGAEGVFKIAV